MQQTQKAESLGVLAGGIAHDFNNLLTGIIGNAELSLLDLPQESPAWRRIHKVKTVAARAADLTRQMLDYSGRGSLVLRPLDLTELVRDMVQLLEATISRKAKLVGRFQEGLPGVEGDATQLRQILVNLVINASEALGENPGRITVATGQRECTPEFLADTYFSDDLRGGAYVFLEVSDTG